ncbi:MAG: hypothetical protein IJV64_03370 [Oscillospiraceae bacterium]|nr:hypothetical protein [Oscillospiraceae bacterium]
MNPKRNIDASCKGRFHLDIYLPACMYIINTTHCRPCPAGKGCTAKISPEAWQKLVEGQKDREERARRKEQVSRGGFNKPKPKRMEWTPEACERLRQMLGEGLSGPQIARTFGTSANAIYSQTKRLGLSKPMPITGKQRGRPATVWNAEKNAELLRLRSEGLTHRQIGERLGVTTKAIETRLFVLRSREKNRQP